MSKKEMLEAEMKYIFAFINEGDISYEIGREQLRALWTAAALKADLVPDSSDYDALERQMWEAIEKSGETGCVEWHNADEFSNFMCKFLI